MSEITLKRKVTLRDKGDSALFTFSEKFKIELLWSTNTDLDLCVFYKTHNGVEGGVFSNEYRQNVSDLGCFDKFPFILLMGDAKTPSAGGESNEEIRVKNIDQLSELYICIVNYGAAIDNKSSTFNQHTGSVEIQTDTSDHLEVLADSDEPGHVYLICKIENTNGKKKAINEKKVYTLGQAFDQIPGFKLICN